MATGRKGGGAPIGNKNAAGPRTGAGRALVQYALTPSSFSAFAASGLHKDLGGKKPMAAAVMHTLSPKLFLASELMRKKRKK